MWHRRPALWTLCLHIPGCGPHPLGCLLPSLRPMLSSTLGLQRPSLGGRTGWRHTGPSSRSRHQPGCEQDPGVPPLLQQTLECHQVRPAWPWEELRALAHLQGEGLLAGIVDSPHRLRVQSSSAKHCPCCAKTLRVPLYPGTDRLMIDRHWGSRPGAGPILSSQTLDKSGLQAPLWSLCTPVGLVPRPGHVVATG